MRYATNHASFDLVPGPRSVDYVVLGAPRTGSNMLCRILWLGGNAGAPDQYLNKDHMLDFCQREMRQERTLVSFSHWERAFWVDRMPIERYLAFVRSIRTAPNGAFGLRLHGSNLFQDHLLSVDVGQLLQGFKVLRLRRRDGVAQAVSLVHAVESGQWMDDDPAWTPPRPSLPLPAYDRTRIVQALEYLAALDANLDKEQARWGLDALEVHYEDVCQHREREMRRIYAFLGVQAPPAIPSPNIRRQVSESKAQWIDRFRAEQGDAV